MVQSLRIWAAFRRSSEKGGQWNEEAHGHFHRVGSNHCGCAHRHENRRVRGSHLRLPRQHLQRNRIRDRRVRHERARRLGRVACGRGGHAHKADDDHGGRRHHEQLRADRGRCRPMPGCASLRRRGAPRARRLPRPRRGHREPRTHG